jgi:Lysozyme like domain/Putative peptidoglycan binding domain
MSDTWPCACFVMVRRERVTPLTRSFEVSLTRSSDLVKTMPVLKPMPAMSARQRALRGALLGVVLALGAGCDEPARDAAFDEPAPAGGSRRTWPVMREGDRGDDVIAARHLLRHRRHAVAGESAARCADPACKTFDIGVDAAVRSFQRAAGLEVDGIVGPLTWEALIAEVRPGDVGPAVLAAHHLLSVRAGFTVPVDGELGEASEVTAAALAQFAGERCLLQPDALGVYGWSALLGGFGYCEGGPDGKLALAAVARHARDAGVPCGEPLEIAVSVAVAESGLRAYAINRNGATSGCADGSADVGLWQINDCYHPAVLADCALDAACNARAMSDISFQGADWSPWTTYRNGAYRDALEDARAAATAACR